MALLTEFRWFFQTVVDHGIQFPVVRFKAGLGYNHEMPKSIVCMVIFGI